MKWFQVDSDTPNDPKIKAIIRRGVPDPSPGQAAAGALLLLWCYIADHGGGEPGEGVDTNGLPLPLPELADECLFENEAALVAWLEYLATKRHIDPERWAANQTVVLPAMRTRADSYAKSKGRGDSRKFTRTDNILPLQDTTNKQDKTIHPLGMSQPGQDNPGENSPEPFRLSGPSVTADDLVAVWNARRTQGPQVRQLTPERRKACTAALKLEPDLARWGQLVTWMETQDWMNASGKGDHPNWRADLEFVTRPKKLPGLFERMDADLARRGSSDGRNGRTGTEPGKFAQAVSDDQDPT